MAVYRKISTSFWTDSKVYDDFSADDRYLYLYLFTNPHSNLCGCYEISYRQISIETGLDIDNTKKVIGRLQNTHNVIRYNSDTKEVLILNWHKYNWTSSEKFRKPLYAEIEKIKDSLFRDYLVTVFNGNEPVDIPVDNSKNVEIIHRNPTADTVSEEENDSEYGMQKDYIYTVTVTDTVSASDTDAVTDTVSDIESDKDIETKEKIKEIVDYFNEITGKHYTYTGKDTVKFIKARLKDKFTVDDFKTVIYKKTQQWKGTEMEQYIRPQTLFSNKFESYLNQSTPITEKDELDEWALADFNTFEPIVVEGEIVDG